jgi:hypothetical protein
MALVGNWRPRLRDEKVLFAEGLFLQLLVRESRIVLSSFAHLCRSV